MWWLIGLGISFLFVVYIIIKHIHEIKSNTNLIETTTNQMIENGFTVSNQVSDSYSGYSLLYDDTQKKWAVFRTINDEPRYFHCTDLVEYSIEEDGDSIIKGRVGSAIIGGALFGGIGAIVGAAGSRKIKRYCSSIKVNITVNNSKNTLITIPLIQTSTDINSVIYNNAKEKAREFSSILAIIKHNAEQIFELKDYNNMNKKLQSSSDEIEKFYMLKEKGIITEEEFQTKKSKLLNDAEEQNFFS